MAAFKLDTLDAMMSDRQLSVKLSSHMHYTTTVHAAPERVVKGDLCQVSSQLLEVDVLGTTTLQSLMTAAAAAAAAGAAIQKPLYRLGNQAYKSHNIHTAGM
jgi:hypothetical protein